MRRYFFLMVFFACSLAYAQDIIDISVKGISDDKKEGAQKDRMEAIMDAKRQACEKAGITITSESKVEDFQLTYDMIESKAEAVLLPGFQVMDIGYVADGTYNVVLVGKLKIEKVLSKDVSSFMIILNIRGKKKLDRYTQLLDKLYEWLSIAHGEFSIAGKSLDDFEENLMEISMADTLHSSDTRIYAFKYELPSGKIIYKQRTPSSQGGVSKHDFALKLRSQTQYVMEVDHPNALYFKRPHEFDGSITKSRNFRKFPGDFATIYTKE